MPTTTVGWPSSVSKAVVSSVGRLLPSMRPWEAMAAVPSGPRADAGRPWSPASWAAEGQGTVVGAGPLESEEAP